MRTVIVKQLKSDFWVVSAVDKDLRVFMSDSYTDSGMMFNTYLMLMEEDAILFGAPPARQTDEWLRLIAPFIDEKKQLTYVSFCDRNDARAIEKLSGECPGLIVIGSPAALYALDDCAATKICVRGSRTLMIGSKEFTFTVETAGNLCVSCEEEKILLSASGGVLSKCRNCEQTR